MIVCVDVDGVVVDVFAGIIDVAVVMVVVTVVVFCCGCDGCWLLALVLLLRVVVIGVAIIDVGCDGCDHWYYAAGVVDVSIACVLSGFVDLS